MNAGTMTIKVKLDMSEVVAQLRALADMLDEDRDLNKVYEDLMAYRSIEECGGCGAVEE